MSRDRRKHSPAFKANVLLEVVKGDEIVARLDAKYEAHLAYTDLKETVHRLDERFLYGHVTDGKSHRPYVRPEQVAARLLELEVHLMSRFGNLAVYGGEENRPAEGGLSL